MIDITLLRNDPDLVRRMVALRGSDVDVDKLIELDVALRARTQQSEELRSRQRSLGKAPRTPEEIEAARGLKEELRQAGDEVQALQDARDDLWARLPNLLADDTPEGEGEEGNVELRRIGDPVAADDGRAHDAVGTRLEIFDLERGAEVAGSGFYYWRGAGARMAWALFSYALDHLAERGFTPMMTPVVARDKVLFGTGYLPFFAGEIYRIENTDLSLIGTSEQTLIGYYGDSVLDADELPILVTAFTPCFRTEAGAAGKATRGGFRVHQFHKVEQIVICRPEDSQSWLDRCQENAEAIMSGLGLPYRVVRVCVGDLGAPAYKKYDTEAWFPSFGTYRETHSNSNLTDYQARRFKIRYRGENGMVFPHTISATAITDRALLAILENNVRPDGSVVVPEVLRPYLGGMELISPR